eukprot:1046920-Pyramimonas_sp.AAC.1
MGCSGRGQQLPARSRAASPRRRDRGRLQHSGNDDASRHQEVLRLAQFLQDRHGRKPTRIPQQDPRTFHADAPLGAIPAPQWLLQRADICKPLHFGRGQALE